MTEAHRNSHVKCISNYVFVGEDSGEGKKNDLSYMIRQQCSPSQKKESPPAYSPRESKHHKQMKSSEESFVLASHRNRCTIQQSEELHDETINHGSEVRNYTVNCFVFMCEPFLLYKAVDKNKNIKIGAVTKLCHLMSRGGYLYCDQTWGNL